MVRNTPKNAEPTAKAKLPPFVRGLLCIGTVLLVCFVEQHGGISAQDRY